MAWQRSFAGTACAVLVAALSPLVNGCTDSASQTSQDVRPRSMDQAIDHLFDPGRAQLTGETHALVVMQDGKIVAERYADGFAADTPMPSWSLAKTVTGLLAGIMVGDGRLALDSPVPVAAWQRPGDPRANITLRHLLTMTSGLRHNEDTPPEWQTDSVALLFGADAADSYAAARGRPIDSAPGSTFLYSSATTQILTGMMADQLTIARDPASRRAAMEQFLRSRLAEPLGLKSLRSEYDAAGTLMGTAFMHMSARDYARIGELIRNGGRAGGRQIVPARWTEEMTSPSSANGGYGLHLWINRKGAEKAMFVGRLSKRVYGAAGLWGQMIVVVPERDLVVVRLGVTPHDKEAAMRADVADLIETIAIN